MPQVGKGRFIMAGWHFRVAGKRGIASGRRLQAPRTWRNGTRLWDRLRAGAADRRVFLILCIAGLLAAAAVSFFRPGSVRAQNGSAAGETLVPSATAVCDTAAALCSEGKFVEAMKALAALDEERLSKSDRVLYEAETVAIMKAVRQKTDALVSAGKSAEALALAQSCLAETFSEQAEALFAGGKYAEAVAAANAAASAAPGQAGDVEPLIEKSVGAWYSEQTDELVRLAEEKGSEVVAYNKMQEICSTLDTWQAPRLDERKNETQVRWARKTAARLSDESLLTAALDILQANKPATTSDPMWEAPVVRAEKIDERNLQALIDVWTWARANGPTRLLHRKAIQRAIEIPLGASLLQGTGPDKAVAAWSAVWMLLESGHGQEASVLIARLYEKVPIAPNYEIEAEFARLYAELQCQHYDAAIAAADRLLANDAGAQAGADRGAGQLRIPATYYKFCSLMSSGRTGDASAVAAQMARDWPGDRMTATAGAWVARQQERGASR
jgi:tetratricopeptide (TPR) repeat protein